MVADLGAGVTREKLLPLMVELERRHPGDRENSLLASVRLSLTRLLPKQREQVRALAVFHGAANVGVLARVLEVASNEALSLCQALIDLGLAEGEGLYLLPDPALGVAMVGELAAREREQMESRWLDASVAWMHFLYEQRFTKPSVASEGMRHALGWLLALVAVVERAVGAGALSADEASEVVSSVEQFLENSGNIRAIRLIAEARQRLAGQLVGWSSAIVQSRLLEIDRHTEAADLTTALAGARALQQEARWAGPGAYANAAYDIAGTHLKLAQVLAAAGRVDEALAAATEAEREFRELAAMGSIAAAEMAAASLGEQGRALRKLGRLDEAAAAYEKAIDEADALDARRNAAISRSELGIVRMFQGRDADAIAAYDRARRMFEVLDEPASVATAWHMVGMVHRRAKRLDAAERAYLHSLDIATRLQDRRGQADTLNELGTLYGDIGRLEESTGHYRRSADLYAAMGDQSGEGVARSNLARCLHGLQRYATARVEAERAIELKREFGHAAQPWKTWAILWRIEHDLGNTEAVLIARQRAIDAYASYRRDGGYSQQPAGELITALAATLAAGVSPQELSSQLTTPPGVAAHIAAFGTCLRAILSGGRDSALLADPALEWDEVVELTLLLETLSSPGRPGQA